ncbi:MAG: PKD domain-containing protein [Flavobacteriales bacterium]|nr:PKD domain-containing protein [Flavobacteriales bacterium]
MNRTFVIWILLGLLWPWQSVAQTASASMMVEPFVNKVFIAEKGQFHDKLEEQGTVLDAPILFGVENAEFNAYFTENGIHFQYAEYELIPESEREHNEQEPEEREMETIWHAFDLQWVNQHADMEVLSQQEVSEYYNYSGIDGKPNINFVPAFKQVVYHNVFQGVDAIFELPAEGGIKYRFELRPGASVQDVAYRWNGDVSLTLDADGNLELHTPTTLLKDKAPNAQSAASKKEIPIHYKMEGNEIRFDMAVDEAAINEGIIIDPWIYNTSYPDINHAVDIQEDAAGNVVVQGNHTNFQVQKFSPAGVLQWTYVTNSTFLGDIAVDNPGNVYIIGGYPNGKRQKLDPSGVQLWTFAGLVEEWRLAFNYSKTVLTVGGYFLNPGNNNLGRMDLSTGVISDQIVYGLETRCIATDCNGDMYSLHVTFGSTGVAATNTLRKTNANFTPAGSVPSGFLLSESEPSAGYVPNPSYHPYIYQGFNGLVVSGPYVYMTDGATVRRVNKSTLTILNSATVTGGAKLMNSGMAADLCGNIYVGSQTGIVKFDSTLNYVETIATPGAVYDIIMGSSGELLVCGDGFVGSFAITCSPPPPITALANNACDGTGVITIDVAGGLAPYTYEWQPGGQTTNPITGLAAGTYTYTVNDAFCRTFVDSVQIYELPTPTFTAAGVSTNNTNANSVCLGETFQFSDNSVSNDGTIVSWDWDFGDGTTSTDQNPTHDYTAAGTYDVKLVVVSDHGCADSTQFQVNVDPLPAADFTATDVCLGTPTAFTDASTISAGTIAAWGWDFGDGNTSTQQNPSNTYATAGTYTVGLAAVSANGCASAVQHDVDVYVLPQADFTVPTTCVNDPADLIDASTAGDWPITSWQWTAEGQSLSGSSVQHTFSGEGTFPVQLLVQDQFGCVDSVMQQVTISVRPQLQLSVNDDCAGAQFVFTNTSSIQSGSIDSTHWDFGDGNASVTVSPTNVYAQAGVYTVVLYAQSDLGCAADTTFQVEAFPNPVAGLQWQNQCDGTAIPLNETSTVAAPGQLLNSNWTMGDGTVLTDTSLNQYLYATYGDYTIQLDVETQDGCTDSQTFTVSVHAVPVADFSFTNICESDSVHFQDQSNIAQGAIVGWQWTFGNGQSSTASDPAYQSYPADGIYPVQLTVTSDSGCVAVLDDSIEVYSNPIAAFMFDSVCFPGPIQFTDLSDPNGSYGITQWSWVFSNAQSSTQQSPAMMFPSYGAYGATLTVTNSVGCKNAVTLGDALLHPLPVADFTTTLQHCFLVEIPIQDASTVDVLSDDQIVDWSYDLGDGNMITTADGTYQYGSAGFYDLTLTVTTNHGCEDDETKTVEVWPLPSVSFSADPEEGCNPLFVRFSDGTSIPSPYTLSSWRWDVGDGTDTIAVQNPTHLYDATGTAPNDSAVYDVGLVVTSGNGCVDSLTTQDLIVVHPLPEAHFSSVPEKLATIIDPLFKFTDLSTENVTFWNWTFGDGLGAHDQNPEYAYADTGTFVVTLGVATDFGCADTISYIVKVEPYFSFYIPSAFTPNGDGRNDGFFGTGEYLKAYNMKIFDRWGEMIFESNDQNFKWDGTYKGAPAKADQYVYQFNIIDWEGNDHRYTGGFQLLR